MPKVSVIMATLNGSKYIKDSIESILSQTYKDWEFIICDDGSIDTTYSILTDYVKNDNRFIILKNDINMGLAASLNKCIAVANGEYIARMDDDDISFPERLAKQVEFLQMNSSFSFVGSNIYLFDEKGVWGESKVQTAPDKITVWDKVGFCHPTIVIRSDVLKSVNCYNSSIKRTEDYDLWCRLYAEGYYGYNIKECTLNYRQDNNAYKKREFKYYVEAAMLKKQHYLLLKIPSCYLWKIYLPIIKGLLPIKLKKFYNLFRFRLNSSTSI